MVTETAMLAAVALIYDADLDPTAWPAALEHVAAMLGTNSATIGLLDPRIGVLYKAHVRADPQAMDAYANHYHRHDPILAALHARPAGFEHAVQSFAFRDAGGAGAIGLCRARHHEAFDAAKGSCVSTRRDGGSRQEQARLGSAQTRQGRAAPGPGAT